MKSGSRSTAPKGAQPNSSSSDDERKQMESSISRPQAETSWAFGDDLGAGSAEASLFFGRCLALRKVDNWCNVRGLPSLEDVPWLDTINCSLQEIAS